MAARMTELLNRYGDREFGEEWWPQDARAWLEPEKAATLSRLLRDPEADSAEVGELMTEYGETKFGTKWRPWDATESLDLDDARELTELLSHIGTSQAPQPRA